MIGSVEKVVSEAFVSALKALIGKIETTKIDIKSLEEKAREGISVGSAKQKVIWSLCLLQSAHANNEIDLSRLHKIFSELLFEGDFLLRKTAMFIISFITRTKRILNKRLIKHDGFLDYKPLELFDFIDRGYLRPEHDHIHLVSKQIYRDYKAYYECEVAEK